jgi:DNA-binding response OmpR family regulator
LRNGTILAIDDDEDILQLVSGALKSHGFEVITAKTGQEGLSLASTQNPDLIILDIELPDNDGIQVCQEIRRSNLAPIIFLTVRNAETDVVLGLGVGADNYMTKPFSIPELVARVEATLRREKIYAERKKSHKVIEIGELTIDLSAHEAHKSGQSIDLTPTEFQLLKTLAEHTGQALSRDQLLDTVWQLKADDVYTRTVDVHIGRLRKKIEDDPKRPRYIVTVPGLGYKMRS